jgi:peptide-methionine (S)-S-oxide reductase
MGCFWGAERKFWENHDPTQGMRQGNDVGTQYRSAVYTFSEAQQKQAEASRDAYQHELDAAGYGPITTEIREAPAFWYAEDYHQQYLHKVPGGTAAWAAPASAARSGWPRPAPGAGPR